DGVLVVPLVDHGGALGGVLVEVVVDDLAEQVPVPVRDEVRGGDVGADQLPGGAAQGADRGIPFRLLTHVPALGAGVAGVDVRHRAAPGVLLGGHRPEDLAGGGVAEG